MTCRHGKLDGCAVCEEIASLRADLATRTKQLGVACMKHDLTHALACGRCYDELAAALRTLLGSSDMVANAVTIRHFNDARDNARTLLARIDGSGQP